MMNWLSLLFLFLLSSTTFGVQNLNSAGVATCSTALQKTNLLKILRSNFFVTGRSLNEYIEGLFFGFKKSLESLKQEDVWIDLGSGKGKAALEFLQTRDNIKASPLVVLITFKSGRWRRWPQFSGKLKVLEGQLFEEIPKGEIPQARLVTDFFGVLSYTLDLTRTLNQVFSHLQRGGELYLHSNHSYTMIEDGHGKIMGLTGFLKSLPGIKVEGQYGILKVTKTAEQIEVPQLELLKVDTRTRPFHRRFVWVRNQSSQVTTPHQ
jgi:hypothetical protein